MNAIYCWKCGSTNEDANEGDECWACPATLSCSAPATGSVPPLSIADALANFEDALGHLHCVLFRDGIGERFSDALCVVNDEILRFKEQNRVIGGKHEAKTRNG